MAHTIRIKRQASSSLQPSSLSNGELAFNENTETLYYGKGTGGAGGTASSIIPIGGIGSFVGLTGNQSIAGVKTFTGTVIVPTPTANTHAVTKTYVDTNALSASTTSTQAGYFGDIYLYDDSTPSHYLQITNSANLTAARSLSINVNDANRIISLSGNLTVSSAATISGTNTGDQTITLTGDVTGSGTGSFATTLATVNSNVGSYTAATVTVDAKGRITAASANTIPAAANNGTLTLAVAGTGLSGSQTFTANQSGNATFTVTSNATNANTGGAIVARDGSGNFSAGTITAALSGNASTATELTNFNSTTTTSVGTDNAKSTVSYISGISLFSQSDGALYSHVYSSLWKHNIYGDYRTGQLAVRGKNNNTWTAWRTVLDSTNYTSYAPTLTGSGASGSWGISVTGSSASCTGNAATATTLQTARTINGTSFNGSANITITANTPNTLTRGTYLTGANFNGGTATTWAVDATDANTASKVVARDGSGNFSAGTITVGGLNGSTSTMGIMSADGTQTVNLFAQSGVNNSAVKTLNVGSANAGFGTINIAGRSDATIVTNLSTVTGGTTTYGAGYIAAGSYFNTNAFSLLNTNTTVINAFGAATNLTMGATTGTTTIRNTLVAGSINADDIKTGTVATARLGSGTANSTTYLRGDNTWATVSGGGSVAADDDQIILATQVFR